MLKQSSFVKIRTAVPVDAADAVRDALAKAGAGKQGNYEACSTSYVTAGRFTPILGANPTIGVVGEPQTVPEEMIEMLCHTDLLTKAIAALKEAHPYEEPAIDILPRFELE